MTIKNIFLVSFVSSALLALAPAFAQAQSSLDGSSGSSVKIVSIHPATSIPLKEGETMRVSAEVDYVLAAPNGILSVFVQSDEGRSLVVTCTNPPISTGQGRVTATADILVKDTYSVHFIVALYHNDGRSTAVTASRTYVVDKK